VATATATKTVENLKFQDNSDFPVIIEAKSFPLHGYDAFPLGGVDSACFCGWAMDPADSAKCVIPTAVCSAKNLTHCTYILGSVEGHAFTQQLVDDWTRNGNWDCPENDFSDSWGIVPADSADEWISHEAGELTVQMADLLSFGLAGMRIGNIGTLPQQAKLEGVHPGWLPPCVLSCVLLGGYLTVRC
jgi:hypothetical protein